MELKQTFPEPLYGYWDGGKRESVTWSITDQIAGHDSRGTFSRIGSWSANHWFHVAKGKTDKLTLRNAMFHLRGTQVGRDSRFEYVA